MLTPVLTDNWGSERSWTLKAFEDQGGYAALRTALSMPQDEVIEVREPSAATWFDELEEISP